MEGMLSQLQLLLEDEEDPCSLEGEEVLVAPPPSSSSQPEPKLLLTELPQDAVVEVVLVVVLLLLSTGSSQLEEEDVDLVGEAGRPHPLSLLFRVDPEEEEEDEELLGVSQLGALAQLLSLDELPQPDDSDLPLNLKLEP